MSKNPIESLKDKLSTALAWVLIVTVASCLMLRDLWLFGELRESE